MSQSYVLGFAFQGDDVLLIRKNKPDFMAGKLNGIGGKVDGLEKPIRAMLREFWEETGITTLYDNWHQFGSFFDKHCLVDCFYSTTIDISLARSMESEQVGIYNVDTLHCEHTLDNLMTLIHLARQPHFKFASLELR